MGGGDLNMKKSWHPLLLKNQERVWLEEKRALEEKKKLDQLRKEKEEERQLQELQRLQEEQTGKKRTEKLEWMYSTPATGSSQNPNDLEDYLLGKKRVDKMLIADENSKLAASHKSFIAVQNANTSRDIAAKIREDPLLAIKQQEQSAYQALLSNPLRLAKMQKDLGVKPAKDKKDKKREKEERKRLKRERKHRRERELRSPSPSAMEPYRQRSPDHGKRSRSPSPRFRSPVHKRVRVDRSPPRPHSTNDAEARNARLAAMTSNATAMSADRQQRLAALLEKEKYELEADEQARAKSKGMSGFLNQEQKRVFGGVGGLEDRIRRGRGGMVVDAD